MFNKKGIALNHLTYDDLPHIGHSICTSIIATVKNNLSAKPGEYQMKVFTLTKTTVSLYFNLIVKTLI